MSSRDNAQKHFFSPRQDDTLRRLNAQGHTDAEIAYELGLTKAQIGDRRRRLKIQAIRPPCEPALWTPEDDAILERLRTEGASYEDCVKATGKSIHACKKRWQRIQRNRRPEHERLGKPWTAQDDECLLRWRRDGVRWEDVAKRLGRPMDGCRSRYRRLSWRDVPSDDEQRREVVASLVRAENAAKWNSYRKRYKISSTWTPGDPVA